MEFTERIAKIKGYFRSMQVEENIIYIVVVFPDNWKAYNDIEDKFNVTVRSGNNPGEYYFFTNLENGFDPIFDAIDYNIKQMKEGIERARLLNEKVKELKELFSDRDVPIESLRTLTFVRVGDERSEPIGIEEPESIEMNSFLKQPEKPNKLDKKQNK